MLSTPRHGEAHLKPEISRSSDGSDQEHVVMLSRHTLSVMAACGLGSLLGALIGLYVAPFIGLDDTLSLIIGILVGGLIGYASVEPHGLIAGITPAYQETPRVFAHTKRNIVRRRRIIFNLMLGGTTSAFYLGVISVSIATLGISQHRQLSAEDFLDTSTLLLSFALGGGIGSFLMALATDMHLSRNSRRKIRRFAILLFPPILPYTVVRYVLIASLVNLWQRRTAISEIMAILATSLWTFFLYVHSDRRMLCFLDASLGACLGIMIGNPLAGALVGATAGLVSHEFIVRYQRRHLAV